MKSTPQRALSGGVQKFVELLLKGKEEGEEYVGVSAEEIGIPAGGCISMMTIEIALIKAGIVTRPAEGKTSFAPFYRILPGWRNKEKPASSNILKVAVKVN